MRSILVIVLLGIIQLSTANLPAQEVLQVWDGTPPGEQLDVGPEEDITKPTDRLIAGRRIIKLKNVSLPEAHIYLAPKETRNGSAVVICPGGGFNILAWDLEGTEVAEWLNTLGVSAIVLKYRVPTSQQEQKWKAPVQDTQRTISLVRHHAKEWGLNKDKIGVLGFSAGGHTAARAAIMQEKQYEPTDEIGHQSHLPDAAILIYPAWLVEDDGSLITDLKVTEKTPPTFLVHAFNDGVSAMSSISLMAELKKKDVPAELHIFESGGHGYGLRPVKDQPITNWAKLCEDWLKRLQWVKN
ncbi:alpha/beta hydrolase [Planctomicrobium sp.]|jgi:acetyl esterase/lipase|nr:alpha/beta hydrolase [Planctomicrobium sp.]MDB4742908.1 alpha/beta hydrolase [Planctomicrobium sp.]